MRFFLLLLILVSAPAAGHKPSDSYLSLTVEGNSIRGQWDIALRDLDYALGLDGTGDGAITWGELRSREAAVWAYALARLHVGADAVDCPLTADRLLVDEHTDGHYAVIQFSAPCPTISERLTVEYRLFFDLDPQHRGLLRLTSGDRTDTAVFAPDTARQQFASTGASKPLEQLLAYGREGVWHIWIGYDHILFLLSLLLPAVLVRDAGRWRRAASFRAALWDAVRVVTAFTLAHSLTLSLAALGYVDLPSRWVESAIAASVIAAAANNLLPFMHRRRAVLAFGFGLVHGLGFASVLSDLGLPEPLRLAGLFGFNLGVELGQLAVVGAFLPLAYGLSRFRLYEPAVLKAGSAGIALLAGVWLIERAFDFPLGL